MTDQVLYRKYRPKDFDDVLGQEHVVSVLKEAIERGNIAHAYLFAGSRGTGKTSIARILARAVGTSEKDLYEIDAASNRGIDDIRALREAVTVLPFESKYKVYIIDEVHMLTKEAFNALLKTLEEPPSHALFILATTEADRLPETIVSRCQVFTFKKPSSAVLKEMVTRVAKKEGFTLEHASAELISLLADGSFRDAHGILQKILSSSKDKKVSVEEVEKVTGAPKGSLVNGVLKAVSEGNLDSGLKAVNEAASRNVDMRAFLKLILHKIRAVLLLRYSSDLRKELEEEFTKEDFDFLDALAKDKGAKMNSDVLKEFLSAYEGVGKSHIQQLPLELALIKLIAQD